MANTDWNSYYSNPYKLSSFSRKITSDKLIRLMTKFNPGIRSGIKIAELGGANSCFYEAINKNLNPEKYLIVDNNQLGLDKTTQRLNNATNIELEFADIVNTQEKSEKFDIVFSVGLIEHFTPALTMKCIASHFLYLKNGGICIITFPTPTWLYKITRKFAELLGLWIFYDERPLKMSEVLNELYKHSEIKHTSITWSIFLTQGVIVATKKYEFPNSTD
jgi:SAM-dependent methyltransferase